MTEYEIDEDMLGTEWKDGQKGLQEFCKILQEIVGDNATIVCITDSANGANNENEYIVTEYQWSNAIDEYFRRYPNIN